MARPKKELPEEATSVLDRAVAEIRSKYGAGSIHVPGEELSIDKERFSTGISALDDILGGGIARGTTVEIYGAEGAGKSTLCLQIIATAQKAGMKTVYIDMEQVLNTKYATDLGVDVDALYLAQPDSMEQAFTIVEALVRTGEIGIVVVDSLASLVPEAELTRDVGEQTMGLQAKGMSTWLRRFNPVLAQTNTTLIFTNQLREKLGGYGNPQTTPGGRAIKFYASYRIEVAIIERLKQGGIQTGNKLRITAVKNKWGNPYRSVEIDLNFGEGVDTIGSLIDTAVNLGVIAKSGNWYSFNPTLFNVENNFNGKSAVRAFLLESPETLETLSEGLMLLNAEVPEQ